MDGWMDGWMDERMQLSGSWVMGSKLLGSKHQIINASSHCGPVPVSGDLIMPPVIFSARLGLLGGSLGPSGSPWGGPRGSRDPFGIVSGCLGELQGGVGVLPGRSRGALGRPGGCSGDPLGIRWGVQGGPRCSKGCSEGPSAGSRGLFGHPWRSMKSFKLVRMLCPQLEIFCFTKPP